MQPHPAEYARAARARQADFASYMQAEAVLMDIDAAGLINARLAYLADVVDLLVGGLEAVAERLPTE